MEKRRELDWPPLQHYDAADFMVKRLVPVWLPRQASDLQT